MMRKVYLQETAGNAPFVVLLLCRTRRNDDSITCACRFVGALALVDFARLPLKPVITSVLFRFDELSSEPGAASSAQAADSTGWGRHQTHPISSQSVIHLHGGGRC